MHSSVLQFIRGKRPAILWCSYVLLSLMNSQNTFAVTARAELSAKSQQNLKEAQQQISDKKYQRALELSSEILTESPQQFEAQFIRAAALSHLNKLDESIVLYKAILKAHPQYPETYNNLADIYAQQGNLDLARQTLEQGIATNEQYKTLYENLSAIYVEMARGAYSKALKLGVQVKAVQLKTLQMASIDQVSSVPLSEPVENNAVIKVAAAKAISATANSNRTVMLEQKPQLAVTEPAKVQTEKPAVSTAVISPVSAVSAKAKIKPASKTGPTLNKDEVITALHGWAAAWSAQAVDLYLSFYGDEFKPAKLSKNVWAVQRRIRIKKPGWINVQLTDFNVKIKPAHADRVVVQLVQDYRADNYHDKTKKQFELRHTMDGWRILSEQSLAVIK